MPSPKTNRVGHKYGRLTVLSFSGLSPSKRCMWFCKCRCGNFSTVDGTHLQTGHTTSCGCFQREITIDRNFIHGESKNGKTVEYEAWKSMKARCYIPSATGYKNYGNRGIKVCSRWKNSFQKFVKDMGRRPSRIHSLERVDVNKGYSPNNCIWGTDEIQGANKRNNHKLTFNGITLTVSQWSRKSGINRGTIHSRLRLGWSVVDTLTIPVRCHV